MFFAVLILLCRCQAFQERENGVGEGKQEGRQGRVIRSLLVATGPSALLLCGLCHNDRMILLWLLACCTVPSVTCHTLWPSAPAAPTGQTLQLRLHSAAAKAKWERC